MITKVKVRDVRSNPFQARKVLDDTGLDALAKEIGTVGLWPGALRGRMRNGHVELCFGHRRLKAVKKLGWTEVDVDIVDLSDDEMAVQSLVENLQRESLNDADKADGISGLVQQLQTSRQCTQAKALQEVSSLLGLSPAWVRELMGISTFEEPAKQEIRKGRIKGRTALEAYRIGGARMVQTAAEHQLPVHTLTKIGTKLSAISDEKVRLRVREEIFDGKLTNDRDVEKRGRELAARRQKNIPPDLNLKVLQWTSFIETWTHQLDEVLSEKEYIAYIDTVPRVAEGFRAAIRALVTRLEKFL